MKDQNIAIAAGLIIVVAALGGLTLQNMQAKLNEKESTIEALEGSVSELQAEVQGLIESNEEYSRRCSENEELIRIYEENFHALNEELINSRTNASILESRLHSIMLLVLTRTNPPQVLPRKPVFYIGEVITFKISYDYPLYGSSIKVWDPDGVLLWETDPLIEWEPLPDGTWRVTFYNQFVDEEPMLFEEEMPVGNYTWSFIYGDVTCTGGEFSVLVYES
jgi:hypothetical protein